jgi:hypothetical protein
MFVDEEPEHGLHLQLHKSSITSDADAINLRCLFPASLRFNTFNDGQKTLGCPIGPDLNVQEFTKAKIDNIQLILDRILYFIDSQIEMIRTSPTPPTLARAWASSAWSTNCSAVTFPTRTRSTI